MKSIFFYGLFMDENLLKKKGLNPSKPTVGYLNGYSLEIGERATLFKSDNEFTYGTIMNITEEEISNLYSDASVTDYVPEKVMITTLDNENVEAVVYNLQLEKLKGKNSEYAKSLLKVAQNYGFPNSYLDKIRMFIEK